MREQKVSAVSRMTYGTYRLSSLVPRAGVEPARVAPLVFETSASTDSAIWACFPIFQFVVGMRRLERPTPTSRT